MAPQALREHLEREGFRLSVDAGSLCVEPASALTIDTRRLIRSHRDALLSLVSLSPSVPPARATEGAATADQEAEIRAHVARLYGDHPDAPEALALALAMPEAALDSFRADEIEFNANREATSP